MYKLFRIHRSTERKIIHKWKAFNTALNLLRSGRPSKFTPRSDCTALKENYKIPHELHLRLYRPKLAL